MNTKSLQAERAWSERAEHWSANPEAALAKPLRRSPSREGLVLTGHGMHLRINGGALEVRNGFTHYPQKQEKWRFFRGDQDLPTRIIVLDGSGAVTLDVFSWLSEQNIPLIQIDYRGRVVAAIGTNCLGADPGLLHKQVTAAQCPAQSIAVASWLIRQKFAACRKTLEQAVSPSDTRQTAIERLDNEIKRLEQPWTGSKVALLGLEGKCAEDYFSAWQDITLRWNGTTKKPIPERWKTIGPRASKKNRKNKGATHPVQAMLNYAYAVLESQLRIETARIGLDAATGFLHQQQPDRPALILDLIEPLRPQADEVILKFVQDASFTAGDFTVSGDGVCRLHPQLAREFLSQIGWSCDTTNILTELMRRINHEVRLGLPHRSKAWLAQRAITNSTSGRTA